MVRIQYNKHNKIFFICLPKSMVEAKQWVKGQQLFLVFNERGSIEICDSLPKK